MVPFVSLAEIPRKAVLFLAALLLLRVNNDNNAVVKGQAFNEAKFEELVAKMESDVIELASAVEEAYEKRCDSETITACGLGNYADCLSSFPKQECRGGLDYSSPDCNGSGDNSSTTMCSSLFDFSIS